MPGDAQLPTTSAGRLIEFLYPTGWDVKGGGSRSSGRFDTQKQAIDKANKIIDHLGGGEVTVHGRDGKIRDSDTRAPGRDPNPPRDKK